MSSSQEDDEYFINFNIASSREDNEDRRQEIFGRLNFCYKKLSDQRLSKSEHDLLLLNYLVQSNISKLEKLPLPDNDEVINEQIELCESFASFVWPSKRADLSNRFKSIATSLRIKRLQDICNMSQ
jgi:hypothetical protein